MILYSGTEKWPMIWYSGKVPMIMIFRHGEVTDEWYVTGTNDVRWIMLHNYQQHKVSQGLKRSVIYMSE